MAHTQQWLQVPLIHGLVIHTNVPLTLQLNNNSPSAVIWHLHKMKWDEWVNAMIICKNGCLRAKFFIGYRDATSNRQNKVVENVGCDPTDFNALINSHSSFETSVLKVVYTSRQ